MSIASWTSPPASALTFPISRVISSASSALSRSQQLRRSGRGCCRARAPGTRRQSSQAALAVATARSTSAAVERGKVSISSPVDGFERFEGRGRHRGDSSPMSSARRGHGVDAQSRHAQSRCRSSRNDPRSARARRRSRITRCSLNSAVALRSARRFGPVAAVDDHRHVRVVAVVRDHLVVQLPSSSRRDDAVDHRLSHTRPAAERQAIEPRAGRCPGRCGRRRPCGRSSR